MSLRFIWHIFLKDARRLWWLIVLTLGMLARLVHFDILRHNSAPGGDEGWLYILLPLAWSFLIALACLQDPAIGEAPFWATVPCRWPSLVAAKMLFVAVFIHVPYFVACAVILQGRNFALTDYLPELFGKQLAVLALTASALALAAVVQNVTQFMMIALALAAAVGAPAFRPESPATQHARELLTLPILILAGVWVTMRQYTRASAGVARGIGVAAIVLAFCIWWAPREWFYGFQAVLSPAPAGAAEPAVHYVGSGPIIAYSAPSFPSTTSGSVPLSVPRFFPPGPAYLEFFMPIAVSGPTFNFPARVVPGKVALEDSEGHSWSGHSNRNWSNSGPVMAICCEGEFPGFQLITVERDLFSRLVKAPVKLSGAMLFDYYRQLEPASMPVDSAVAIAGVGRCSNELVGDALSDQMLHVDCESPKPLPIIRAKVTEPGSDRAWQEVLGSSYTFLDTPRGTWLSPINRVDSFLHVSDTTHASRPGGSFQIPIEVIPSAKLTILPEVSLGEKLVHYEFPNLSLRLYQSGSKK